jgi:adenosylcobinamide-GDP ribazoletransferase
VPDFLCALALLTRLGPPRPVERSRIAASVRWYPPVGALVGALCVLPLYAGLAGGHPWVQAWLYVGLNLWITRALHWDGLADLADALGSGAQGPEFRRILRDSRIGAFGALTLCFCLSGSLLLAQAHAGADAFLPLLLAPLVGRSACVLLAATCKAHDAHSLGGTAAAGASPGTALFAACAALAPCALAFSPPGFFALAAGLVLLLARLRALCRRQGGVSGDFLGAAVVAAELLTLAAALLPPGA